jgi:hypothetical protein
LFDFTFHIIFAQIKECRFENFDRD